MKTIRLNADAAIPVLGFGTWQLTGETCVEAVSCALGVGYRHIDTADAYGNHWEVAQGVKKSGVAREEIFITTKVWRTDLAHDVVLGNCDRFLDELGTEYIDLLLIHWPSREGIPVEATLRAMEELRLAGKVRALGVSNFTPALLEEALAGGVEIVNDQVELRPSYNQRELRDFCKNKNISITAYSSLKGGDDALPLIVELAKKYGMTPAQVIINWVIARGLVAIPKSSRPERIKENFEALDFTIEDADLARIDSLPQR
jgi:diketogulonate reductase-like aldo/keto reductase